MDIPAGILAGAAILCGAKKYMCNRYFPEALKFFSIPFTRRQAHPKVKSIYPDRQTFAFRHDSPIWIEFDMPINNATIKERNRNSQNFFIKRACRRITGCKVQMLMFRPYEEYPMDESGAEITVTLLGSETVPDS